MVPTAEPTTIPKKVKSPIKKVASPKTDDSTTLSGKENT
jgi:hypothetical protein